MPAGIITALPPSLEWSACVHLRCPPIRVLPATLGSPCAVPPCPRTVRRDAVPAALPPMLRPVTTTIPSVSAPERFSLVVPTSFLESHFSVNAVLQAGIPVVFRMPQSTTQQHGVSSALGRAHGFVSRHVNPIGLTSYRVSGPQPAAIASGYSLLRWAEEDGCLVVELTARQPNPTQVVAPVASRRLFGDCLPMPFTIRKEPRARVTEPQPMLLPMPLLVSQPLPELSALQALPLPLPTFHQLPPMITQHQRPSQQQQQPALVAQQQGWRQQQVAPPPVAAPAAAPATAFTQQQAVAMELSMSSSTVATAAMAVAASAPGMAPPHAVAAPPLASHSSEPALRTSTRQCAAVRARSVEPSCPQVAVVRSKRLAGKAAAAAAAASGATASCLPASAAITQQNVAAPAAEPAKRHRRAASAEDPTCGGNGSNNDNGCSGGELMSGIELLLAAHMALSQEEAGRPKRMRLQKMLSL